jgi:hypothetical protein
MELSTMRVLVGTRIVNGFDCMSFLQSSKQSAFVSRVACQACICKYEVYFSVFTNKSFLRALMKCMFSHVTF